MVSPSEEARPPAEIPPVKVEVPAEDEVITPPVRVRPFVEASPPVLTESPPVKDEVAAPSKVKVEVPIKGPTLKVPVKMPSPSTERGLAGLVVPMPTFPY